MERIQRALEISRLQRMPPAEPVPLVPAPAAATPAPAVRPAPRPAEVPIAPPPAETFAFDPIQLRERNILMADDPSAAGRSYRMLRAQLLQRVRARGLRVVGVISAVSGEGKTLTAINLALTLAAEPNQSVVLVDLDLRHPSVATKLGIAPQWGLDTWLTQDRACEGFFCQLEGIERLTIVPTLAPLSASSETLAGNNARTLFGELRAMAEHQLVIVDLPPALLNDDVLTVTPLVDGFILVITEGKTRREDVERVVELVGRDRIVGTVLNDSRDSEQRAY
jgi:protein-tyrosine kinase